MKNQPVLNWLVPLIGALAIFSAGIGLFWGDGGSPYSFTSLHGQEVQMYGQGLYRHDTLMVAAGFRGTDAVTLLVALPFLAFSFVRYRRGSMRGALLLTGALSYFLYNGVSMALAAAYNNLFLVYVALMSSSLFAFILALTSIDLQAIQDRVSSRLPHRRIAIFLFFAGAVVLLLWGSEIIGALLNQNVPELLASYTTTVTHAIDMGIIALTVILSGILLLQRAPLGYALAFPMLTLNSLIGIVVIGQTVSQIAAGVVFYPGQLIGIVGSWLILAGLACWMVVSLFTNISD